jgi:xylulokinase
MALIGLDIGTTGCKAHVFSEDLKLLASANREYAVDIPHPQWAEQDAEKVWTLAKDCLRESAIKANAASSVTALSLSVQGEAVAPVDKDGKAMRPMILGMDTRTEEQNRKLRDSFSAGELFNLTGMPVHTCNTLPKLMWLKEHEPQIWKNAEKFLLYEDFIINKLTGIPVISKCLASRTQIYDLEKEQWSEKILNFLGLEKSRFAEDCPSGDAVGKMRANLADELGFKTLPLVAVGGHDQACGALGAGLTRSGLAMVSTGTAEVVEVSMNSPHLNDSLYQGNMSVYLHTFPGLYVVMTLNQSGGFVLRWFRDTFCQNEQETARSQGGDAYNMLLIGAGPEPSPIMLLPHLAGSGTPTFDTLSKGAVVGLTFATTKTDFAKAILDALTFELRLNLDVLKDGGITIDELRAIGGGAKSELWLQLKADVTGIPVVVPEVTEAAGMGAAILAGVAAGVFSNAASAIDSHLKIKRTYTPDPGIKALYDERYELYKKLYPAVKEINHTL